MESTTDAAPLVVVLGPTASGKSALALQLARQFDGEIIAADSRTVYRGLDVGTAKPTPEERRAVPHHLIDVADPDERFTVADFQRLAQAAIRGIAGRGRLPLMVGGTGLYIDAIIYNFSLRPGFDPKQRQALEQLSVEELQARLADAGLPLPANRLNPRHLIRSLEAAGQSPARSELRADTLLIGLNPDADTLAERITARAHQMVEAGLPDEVRRLAARYGWDLPAMQTPAYRAFRPYLEGEATLDEVIQQFIQNDRQYAKRQKTWFKRNPAIHWISKSAEAVDLVTTFLDK